MFCRGGHGELTTKKWLGTIEKQKKKQFEVWDKHRDRGTDRQTESIVDNNRLLG